jgi:hypothetical protein
MTENRTLRWVRRPALYVGWAFLVAAGLVAAYRMDPYVFGFASLGLAWATGAVAIVGVAAVVLSRRSSGSARLLVAVALLVAAVALAIAFRILGGFNWA